MGTSRRDESNAVNKNGQSVLNVLYELGPSPCKRRQSERDYDRRRRTNFIYKNERAAIISRLTYLDLSVCRGWGISEVRARFGNENGATGTRLPVHGRRVYARGSMTLSVEGDGLLLCTTAWANILLSASFTFSAAKKNISAVVTGKRGGRNTRGIEMSHAPVRLLFSVSTPGARTYPSRTAYINNTQKRRQMRTSTNENTPVREARA